MAARSESSLLPAIWNYRHPVAFSAEVTDKPHAATLLDQRLLLARLCDRPACFRDVYMHRGTPFPPGWIDAEELVCAYHGSARRRRGLHVHPRVVWFRPSVQRRGSLIESLDMGPAASLAEEEPKAAGFRLPTHAIGIHGAWQ